MSVTRTRLQRLNDERERTDEKIRDTLALAEKDERDLNDAEAQQNDHWRARLTELDAEIDVLVGDLERETKSAQVSTRVRRSVGEAGPDDGGNGDGDGGDADGEAGAFRYRTFAAFARDELIARFPVIANRVGGDGAGGLAVREQAMDRLTRALIDTTSSDVEGLIPPEHIAQIMDLIDKKRPVVQSAMAVPLNRGKLTYPKIKQRPEALVQQTEKTLAGTANMQIELEEASADTYLGGGDLSWQTIQWSTPDALALWFNLAAEAYARQTETAACDELAGTAIGTASPGLGTAGTEDFAAWRTAILAAIGGIYSNTGGRAQTNTLYLSATRFFQLAALGSDQVVQISPVGNLDIGAMTGTISGLRVVGTYGFGTASNTAIVGDANAFLVGETAGAPVEMRAVEPSIGGMEVGVIGAFKSIIFDPDRFLKLS